MNDTKDYLPDLRLRFNIEHPSFEECYLHGYEHALADKAEALNPFALDTREHEMWQEGWWAGFYGEQPLFELPATTKANEEVAVHAANDKTYALSESNHFLARVLEITGAIAVTAFIGYQVADLVG